MSNGTSNLGLLKLTQERGERSPHYRFKSLEGAPRSFYKCHVKACSVKAMGYGISIMSAREEASRVALEMLINHEEELMKFVQKYRMSEPKYYDTQILESSVVYQTTCQVDNYTTEGYGADPTESKKDAARNMLFVLSLIRGIPVKRPTREQQCFLPKGRIIQSAQHRLNRIRHAAASKLNGRRK